MQTLNDYQGMTSKKGKMVKFKMLTALWKYNCPRIPIKEINSNQIVDFFF